jgi:hypothetical protein
VIPSRANLRVIANTVGGNISSPDEVFKLFLISVEA